MEGVVDHPGGAQVDHRRRRLVAGHRQVAQSLKQTWINTFLFPEWGTPGNCLFFVYFLSLYPRDTAIPPNWTNFVQGLVQ